MNELNSACLLFNFFIALQYPIFHSMQLMMYVGNDLIEAVTVNDKDLRVPGYLGNFKRSLKEKYNTLIRTAKEPIEFLVCNPSIVPEIPLPENNKPHPTCD